MGVSPERSHRLLFLLYLHRLFLYKRSPFLLRLHNYPAKPKSDTLRHCVSKLACLCLRGNSSSANRNNNEVCWCISSGGRCLRPDATYLTVSTASVAASVGSGGVFFIRFVSLSTATVCRLRSPHNRTPGTGRSIDNRCRAYRRQALGPNTRADGLFGNGHPGRSGLACC